MEIINDKEWYSSRKLINMKVLPWKSAGTFNDRLMKREWQSVFNPIMEKKGKRMFYKIKGEYINKYLKSIK